MLRAVAGLALMLVLPVPLARAQASQPEIEALFHRYIDARNRHDVAALRNLMAPDVKQKRHDAFVSGRESILARTPYEAGIDQRIEVRNVVVEGNTVKYEHIEHNALRDALQIAPPRRYNLVVFADGLVSTIDHWKKRERDPANERRLRDFDDWLRKAHPDIAGDLAAGETGEVLTEELGRKVVELAKTWWAKQQH